MQLQGGGIHQCKAQITYERKGVTIMQVQENDKAQVLKNDRWAAQKHILTTPFEPMPIRAVPYAHQIEGYNRACTAMGIFEGGDANDRFK